MVSSFLSIGLSGLESFVVTVETDLSLGLPYFDIVGLPDISIKESRDRVRSALKNSGFNFPTRRIIVNLAPADIKKYGPIYDLPILLAILHASGQIKGDFSNSIFLGELSLAGELKKINGTLPMVLKAKELRIKSIFLPYENAKEAAIVDGIDIFPIKKVEDLKNHFLGIKKINLQPLTEIKSIKKNYYLDFSQIKGQYDAKRAIEIAAAGGHNILLLGPPGSGKSMFAKRISTIMPEMTLEEMIETTKIYSITGSLSHDTPVILERPFRSPHHTVSPAGLSGGGSTPKPGELSLAHNGVIFLDELPEFSRVALEALRQPIEEGTITISRARSSLTYPCSVLLVAAMNPCPCGYFGHPFRVCICSRRIVEKYLAKISGPLLDRIDLHIEVPPVNFQNISSNEQAEKSELIRHRVKKAREIQNKRYRSNKCCNAKTTTFDLRKNLILSKQAENMLKIAFENMSLSARGYEKILRIARTIADLDGNDEVNDDHIAEAIQYRSLDKKYWLFK